MTRLFLAVFLAITFNFKAVSAQQDIAWVQIEAHSTLAVAQDRIRAFAARLPDVNGFALGGGWYGIALGPYTRSDAQRVLDVYVSEREIPADSFLAFSGSFGRQFWPVGANILNLPQATDPQVGNSQDTAQIPQPEPEPQQIEPSDETPRQARASW